MTDLSLADLPLHKVRVVKHGGTLYIRIPSDFAKVYQISEGDFVSGVIHKEKERN